MLFGITTESCSASQRNRVHLRPDSPDKTIVFFTSNLFGASYVFGVEVKKAENPVAADVKDTAELGRQWKPQAPEQGK
jgi:hypothetical protein